MKNELKGVIHKIEATRQVTDKFKSRLFVLKVDTNNNYTDYLPMQVVNDKTTWLDKFQEGDMVEVNFNINGRENKKPTGYASKDFSIYLNVYRLSKVLNPI